MANNLSSNITRPLARVFLEEVDRARVLSKSINTQIAQGRFSPATGDKIDIKRPHQYRAVETADGDLTGVSDNDIIAGKATAEVQDMITVPLSWSIMEETLELDQLAEILRPAATELVTRMETNLGRFMTKFSGLTYGSPGTAVDSWTDVAGAGALMRSIGVPMDEIRYVMNPFTAMLLAEKQTAIYSDRIVRSAWEEAQITRDFGGMKAFTSAMLTSYTSGSSTTRAGTLSATPTATYLSVKDTMIQTLAVAGFSNNATIKAGEVVEVTGRHLVNLATREPIVDAAGSQVKWRGTVVEDVTLSGTGTGNVKVTGPAIWESDGQYNSVDTALTSGDVITILGDEDTIYQPNLFFHRDAFALATVKLPKLNATDTIATTADGISIRVTKYSEPRANRQGYRVDLLPAFGCLNPFFAGRGFGV